MNKPLTFGGFVAGFYNAWGKRTFNGIIKLDSKTHLNGFRGMERFVIS